MHDAKFHQLQIRTPEGITFSYALAGPVTRSLAWIVDAREQAGNGVQLRDMASGAVSAEALAPALPGCDPRRPAPLRVGDHVAYVGMLVPDPAGGFVVAAHGLEAEVGIYTSPGAEPVYVFIEEP